MVVVPLPFPNTTRKRPLYCKLYVATFHIDPFSSYVHSQAFLGQAGGEAIADVLFGTFNPGGRVAVSIPLNVAQLPVYYKCVDCNEQQVEILFINLNGQLQTYRPFSRLC